MTKAWESKSVESQVADSKDSGTKKRGSRLTASEVEIKRRRDVLILSRSRVERDLQASQNERYKAHLTRALADIEAQISALEETGKS
jgi:hypothetical protein